MLDEEQTGVKVLCTNCKADLYTVSQPQANKYSEHLPPRQVGGMSRSPIIGEISTLLALHYYGFTAEELDFIPNYDIKYRLGRSTETDDE